jgi:hypothetical protein
MWNGDSPEIQELKAGVHAGLHWPIIQKKKKKKEEEEAAVAAADTHPGFPFI